MNLRLAALHARRTASIRALGLVVAAALTAGWLAPSGFSFDGGLPPPGGTGSAHAPWLAVLLVTGILCVLHAARTPHRWLSGEGDWMGTAADGRLSLVASSLGGVALGVAATVLIGGALGGALRGSSAEPFELVVLAGPELSIVLAPGESYEQSLGDRTFAPGSRMRVRLTPTLGGRAPITRAALSVAGAGTRRTASVARRTWIEAPASGTLRVENVGAGSLAVLGPAPVEVWTPSSAWLGGSLRMAAHVTLLLLTLSALAFAFGCHLGPAVAAWLALATWMVLKLWTNAGAWLPGGQGLQHALDAVREGRVPAAPAAAASAFAAGAVGLAVFGSAASLRSWRSAGRS